MLKSMVVGGNDVFPDLYRKYFPLRLFNVFFFQEKI